MFVSIPVLALIASIPEPVGACIGLNIGSSDVSRPEGWEAFERDQDNRIPKTFFFAGRQIEHTGTGWISGDSG